MTETTDELISNIPTRLMVSYYVVAYLHLFICHTLSHARLSTFLQSAVNPFFSDAQNTVPMYGFEHDGSMERMWVTHSWAWMLSMALYSSRDECVFAGVKARGSSMYTYDFDSVRIIPRTNMLSPDTSSQRSTVHRLLSLSSWFPRSSLSFRCG